MSLKKNSKTVKLAYGWSLSPFERAPAEATEAAKTAIADALVLVAEGLGEQVAKLVLSVGKGCMDLGGYDAATALVVEQGMQMIIKGQSLREGSRSLKPVQREIALSLETLKANLTISNMLGVMDEETAKMSLALVAEAGRRAQSALGIVLQVSEALDVCISTAILHAQSLSSAPPARVPTPDVTSAAPEPRPEVHPDPVFPVNDMSKVENVAADQRRLLRRLLEDLEMIRRPLNKDGFVLAMRILCESLASGIPVSTKDPFSVPNAALKAVLHHPEGRGRVSILIDEMERIGMPIPDELAQALST